MRRRAKPGKGKANAKRSPAHTAPTRGAARVYELEQRLAETLERVKAMGEVLQEKDRALTEAHTQVTGTREQQTATSEILRLISNSPNDLRTVFDIIAERSTTLTGAVYSAVYMIEGEWIHLRAWYSHGITNTDQFAASFPMPITSETLIAGALRTGTLANVGDMEDSRVPEAGRTLARTLGVRSTLAVPMRRDGRPIGAIGVNRREAHEFTPGEIALLQTFADQAVIAIENVRLFTELQTSNRDLTTSLDTQTATSDILGVISSSPTDTQPVFDAIAESATHLLRGWSTTVLRLDNNTLYVAATYGGLPGSADAMRTMFPGPVTQDEFLAETLLGPQVTVIEDVERDGSAMMREIARIRGWRANLAVPMLREGPPIGLISVTRVEPGPFAPGEIELMKTFADQAVIAIDNVRLFKELEARNSDLTEALARQTATSEVLRVISQSPTDLQPVFDAIAENARRLLRGWGALVVRFDGQLLHAAGLCTDSPAEPIRERFPAPLSRDNFTGAVILHRDVMQIADVETDDDWVSLRAHARRQGWRANLGVPMLHDGAPIGVITVTRQEAGAFSPQEVELLQTFADQAVIAIENVRLFTELQASNRDLTTALDTQTATSDILRVISQSQTDVQPVFDAIVQSAVRLLGAHTGGMTRVVGDHIELVAITSADETADNTLRARFPQPLASGAGEHAQAIRDRQPINIADAETDPGSSEGSRAYARGTGLRSGVFVPMLRRGEAIGAITVWRHEPGGFAEDEIALLQTFADQAVIAIENARLLSELQERNLSLSEALEQQTATSEVLRAISQSQTDAQPVFETIVRNAVRLCDAIHGGVYRFDGELVHVAANEGYTPEQLAHWRSTFPRAVTGPGLAAQTIRTRRVVRIDDIEDSAMRMEVTTETMANLRSRGSRSLLGVPMFRGSEVIGAIALAHREVGAFSDGHIDLLKTFADQAVIAIENVRLFTELQTSNRELTATSEILQVISRSPTDTQPVFDTIAETAHRLCGSLFSAVFRFDGKLLHLSAHHNFTGDAADAYRRVFPAAPTRYMVAGRSVLDRGVAQTVDIEAGAIEPGADNLRQAARTLGVRSILSVPMLRNAEPLGCITVFHREPGAFSDKQIALLRTFADQAVIAIENVRLFTELQTSNRELTTALDTQTATSDILRVISRSQTDVQPVFEAIVDSAVRLLRAYGGALTRIAGDQLELAALTSIDDATDAATRALFPRSLQSEGPFAQAIRDRAPINIADAHTDPRLPEAQHASARARGYRSHVAVPMLRHDEAIGTIAVTRRDPGGFTDDEIALLQTFADQAVIAIENARLLTELQERNLALTESNARVTEALEQQTATSDILRVISRSQTDVQPVFDTIVNSAVRLCDGIFGALFRFDGEMLHTGAEYNYTPEALAELHRVFPTHPTRALGAGRAILERSIIVIPDVEADPEHQHRVLARAIGFRSALFAPMLREGAPIGVIFVARAAPGAFADSEIALLQTFADQAVIAVENVRLFTELQTSNQELTTALDTQTATSDILRVISRSQTDVQPVFDAIVRSAHRLLRAHSVGAFLRVGNEVRLAGFTSTDGAGDAALRSLFPVPIDTFIQEAPADARVLTHGELMHDPDVQSDPTLPEKTRWLARARGFRSRLGIPMRRDVAVIGILTITRREAGIFAQEEIELLKTFADQAVIAIENVRLFTELQASNRDLTTALDTQTATSDILRVISRSQTDVQPVFDAILDSAVRLLGGSSGAVTRVAGDQIELAALTSTEAAADAAVRATFPRPLQSPGTHAQAIRDRAPVNIADRQTDPRVSGVSRATGRLHSYRSVAVVPLLRRDEAIGALGVSRREAGGFTDDEIALLQTFADQAVIAIENARLLSELQARTQELTRSVGELQALGEVGQAISSTLDLQTVLRTIVARATQLANADAGVIYEYDEQREVFEPRATERLEDDIVQTLVATPVRKGQGATGRLAEVREPIQLADLRALGEQIPVRDSLIRAGYRALLAVPLVREDHLIGGLTVFRKTPGEFAAAIVDLLKTFATQSSLAIQNARLFREIAQKSRELEVASQHKSEFLASMSHELRTPLNAIIGFSDVLLQGMFGEMSEKQTEYMQDILASGQHLLSLINDILDLSKIEAGRMDLDLADFHLPSAVDDALLLMRERAGRRGITLERHVDERLSEIHADQRKVKQVLLNLLSNAVKFTPEGGRIDVRAALANGTAEISVTDTGIGIAPEDHDAVFEEFRQVGRADKKAEGTGLGLALCRKFVELHGGRIWVKSQVGAGSTFTFALPLNQ